MPKAPPHLELYWIRIAAQERAVDLFCRDFARRFPGCSECLKQFAYLGDPTASVPRTATGVRYAGKPGLNRVLQALQHHFKNPGERGGYRKPDGLRITGAGGYAELVEVTTASQREPETIQLRSKLEILRRRVNAESEMGTVWEPTRWRPAGPEELYYQVYPRVYVSFEPTYREAAPPGLIFYEIADLRRAREQTVVVPADVASELRRRAARQPLTQTDPASWAESFGREHPVLLGALRVLAYAAGAAACVVGLVLLLDPVPGDELAALAAASALVAFAQGGPLPNGYRPASPG